MHVECIFLSWKCILDRMWMHAGSESVRADLGVKIKAHNSSYMQHFLWILCFNLSTWISLDLPKK